MSGVFASLPATGVSFPFGIRLSVWIVKVAMTNLVSLRSYLLVTYSLLGNGILSTQVRASENTMFGAIRAGLRSQMHPTPVGKCARPRWGTAHTEAHTLFSNVPDSGGVRCGSAVRHFSMANHCAKTRQFHA